MYIILGSCDKPADYSKWDEHCLKTIGRLIPIVAIKGKPELSRLKRPLTKEENIKLGFLHAAKEM